MEPNETIEARVGKASAAFAEQLKGLVEHPFLQDGLVKTAMSDVIWELYHAFPDSRVALADVLEHFDSYVREAMAKDDADEVRT